MLEMETATISGNQKMEKHNYGEEKTSISIYSQYYGDGPLLDHT